MLNSTQKQAIGEILAEAPEQLLEEFINITEIYKNAEARLTDPSLSPEARFNARLSYINNAYNHINLMIKYIAVSANSFSALQSVSPKNTLQQHIQQKANNQQDKEEVNNISNTDEDGLEVMDADELMGTSDTAPIEATPKKKQQQEKKQQQPKVDMDKILSDEFISWGIREDSYSYKILMALKDVKDPKNVDNIGTPYNYIVEQVTDIIDSHKGVVSAGYARIAGFAKFKNGKYFKDFAGKKKEEIIGGLWEFIRVARDKFGGK